MTRMSLQEGNHQRESLAKMVHHMDWLRIIQHQAQTKKGRQGSTGIKVFFLFEIFLSLRNRHTASHFRCRNVSN